MSEVPNLRWFENTKTRCTQCKSTATGILRGSKNESYGPHCERCANRRLKASEKVRAKMEKEHDKRNQS